MNQEKRIPIKIFWKQDQLRVVWINIGEVRFTEPFFDDTIRRCRSSIPGQVMTETGSDELLKYGSEIPTIYPTGFVFHMSRCGSTLIAQMLAASEKNIVLAEASPIDDVLRIEGIEEEQRGELLGAVINSLAQKRHLEEERLFIKFDSWSIYHLPFILKLFPGLPWMFLYRDPIEVMVSHSRKMGMHMVPGLLPSEVFGLDAEQVKNMSFNEYGANVLHSICSNAIVNYEKCKNGVLINYLQLPEVMSSLLSDHFNVKLNNEELLAMLEASKIYSKDSLGSVFKSDSEEKRKSADDALIKLVDLKLKPVYDRLEPANPLRGENIAAVKILPAT